MVITQIPKTLENAWKLFHDKDVYMLTVNWHIDAKTKDTVPAFRLKSLRNTTLQDIKDLASDENIVLVRITRDRNESLA